MSTAPSGLMYSGRGRPGGGTVATMPCYVHVANLVPRVVLAASLRSQLAWVGCREGRRARQGLGIEGWPRTRAAAVASRGPRRRCQAAAERKMDTTSRFGRLSSLM